MEQHGEIILYQPNEAVKLDVRLENDTVWLTQAQMAELFEKDQSVIARHITNVFRETELESGSNMQILHNTLSKYKPTKVYSLDVIISVGYRVKSKRGTQFRQWANKVLKEYLLKGYSINQRITALEKTVAEHSDKIDFFVRSSLMPVEGIFCDGQIFDAYKFATDLIRTAKRSIVVIDNYVDESVLLMLSKRRENVLADIYTARVNDQLRLDLERHNDQYVPINIHTYRQSHDRFVIIDDSEVWHIGASLKDLGKKLFAFSKMNIPASKILDEL